MTALIDTRADLDAYLCGYEGNRGEFYEGGFRADLDTAAPVLTLTLQGDDGTVTLCGPAVERLHVELGRALAAHASRGAVH